MANPIAAHYFGGIVECFLPKVKKRAWIYLRYLTPGSQARLFANAPFAATFAGVSRIDGSNQRG